MTPGELVTWIDKNAARVREYKKGGDGSGGRCDCIGLLIGAWRLAGNRWPWTHGSNYTARCLVRGLAAGQPLRLGDLVFKAREPGESGYDLPAAYRGHRDQRDYYHVGVVTRLRPLEITHCTGVKGGIRRDAARGQWKYSAQFREIREETMMSGIAVITSPDGGKVNLRAAPDKKSGLINRLPPGTEVEVMGDLDGWAYVSGKQGAGYVMSEFLKAKDTPDGGAPAEDGMDDARELISQAQRMLDRALERLGAAG